MCERRGLMKIARSYTFFGAEALKNSAVGFRHYL
jgi:hypothetical protein